VIDKVPSSNVGAPLSSTVSTHERHSWQTSSDNFKISLNQYIWGFVVALASIGFPARVLGIGTSIA
jgi:hypothetical protein